MSKKNLCYSAAIYKVPVTRPALPCMRRPQLQLSKVQATWTNDPNGCARTAMKQNTAWPYLFSTLYSPRCCSRVVRIGGRASRATIFTLKAARKISKNHAAGPSAKSCQTILYLQAEIKPFSRLSAHFVYVFSVTHRCHAYAYHRPHGLSLTCMLRSWYRPNERPHNDTDH